MILNLMFFVNQSSFICSCHKLWLIEWEEKLECNFFYNRSRKNVDREGNIPVKVTESVEGLAHNIVRAAAATDTDIAVT